MRQPQTYSISARSSDSPLSIPPRPRGITCFQLLIGWSSDVDASPPEKNILSGGGKIQIGNRPPSSLYVREQSLPLSSGSDARVCSTGMVTPPKKGIDCDAGDD